MQPYLCRPAGRGREHPVQVATRTLQSPHGVADEMRGHGLRQPLGDFTHQILLHVKGKPDRKLRIPISGSAVREQ